MRRVGTWAALLVFALCVVGIVAWPLWSENDLWSFLFAAVGVLVLVPLILFPPIRALLKVFSSTEPR